MGDAAQRWARQLAAWAIPDHILRAAPESPWGFPPELFSAPEPGEAPHTPSRRVSLDALGDGGSVLDVGAGGGAASLALVPPANHVTAVDQSEAMLRQFAASAERLGVAHREVAGRWPDVAAGVEPADVVVCHHVLYNVADLAPFVAALTDHARRRVVVEISTEHPQVAHNELWERFHGLPPRFGPTVDDALAVLGAVGIDAAWERFERPPRQPARDFGVVVPFLRRRLCLPPEREPEVAAFVEHTGDLLLGEVAALWWPGTAP